MSSKPALKIFLAATLLGGLAACGNSPVDREGGGGGENAGLQQYSSTRQDA